MTDTIDVLSPDGQPGSIPVDQWEEAKAQGFIANSKVRVMDPNGETGSIPAAQLQDAIKAGFKPLSDEGQQHLGKVAGALEGIKSLNPFNQGDIKVDPSALQDENHQYKLKDGSGKIITAPISQVSSLLDSGGFKFADDNAQALYEAHQQNLKDPSAIKKLGYFLDKANPFSSMNTHLDNLLDNEGKDTIGSLDPESKIRLLAQRQAAQSGGLSAGEDAAKVVRPIAGAIGAGTALAPIAGMAGAAAGGGVIGAGAEGVVYNAENIVKTIVDKDPQAAAEQVALGFGLGAILGFGVQSATKLAKIAAKTAEPNVPLVNELKNLGLSDKSSAEDILSGLGKIKDGEHLAPVLSKIDSAMDTLPNSSQLQQDISNLKPTKAIVNGVEKQSEAPEIDALLSKFGDKSEHSLSDIHNMALEAKQSPSPIVSQDAHEALMQHVNAEANEFLTTPEALKNNKLASLYSDFNQAGVAANQARDAEGNFLLNKDTLGKPPVDGAPSLMDSINKFLVDKGSKILANNIPGVQMAARLGFTGPREKAEAWAAQQVANWVPNSGTKVGQAIKSADPTLVRNMLILDASAMNKAKLEQIAPFLKDIGNASTPAIFKGITDPIKEILPSSKSPTEEQLQNLTDKVAMHMGNPDMSNEATAHINDVFSEHPQAQQELQNCLQNLKTTVQACLPKQPPPQPFQKNDFKVDATPGEVQQTNEVLSCLQNPYSLVSGIKDGNISENQVQAVKTAYPGIYGKIVDEITKAAASGDINLSYQQRLSASMIMGQPMDKTMENVAQLQSCFQSAPAQSGGGPPSKAKGGKSLTASKLANSQTMAQRISNN